MKKYLLPIGLFLIISIPLLVVSIWLRNREEKQPEVFGLTDFSVYPSILNMAPSSAFVNEKYQYDILVTDKDTQIEEIFVRVVNGPKWIYADKLSIIGTPTESDIGVNEVAIEVSDGENKVYETMYIVVSYRSEI